jgi:hypothetical protein
VNRLIPSRRLSTAGLSGLLAGLLLAFAVASANGALHGFLHADSPSHASSCVVCLLLQGQVACAVTLVVVMAVLAFRFSWPAPRASGFRKLAALLPPGRAPPVFDLAF